MERSKAKVYKPKGGADVSKIEDDDDDDEYFHFANQLDEAMISNIEKGEYVDLVKLLPKEKILHSSEKLQVINRGWCVIFCTRQ